MTRSPLEQLKDVAAYILGAVGLLGLLLAGIVLGATPVLAGILVTELIPGLGGVTYHSVGSLVLRLTWALSATALGEILVQRVAYRLLLLHTSLAKTAAKVSATASGAAAGFIVGVGLLAPMMESSWRRAVVVMAIAEVLSMPFARLLLPGRAGESSPSGPAR